MTAPEPAHEASKTAIAKCVAVLRADHRESPRHGALTDSAIAERVHGMLVPPYRGPEDWWLVGKVVDEIASVEFNVWFIAETGRIGMSPRGRHVPIGSTPSRTFNLDATQRPS
jgi:hypothetical protein